MKAEDTFYNIDSLSYGSLLDNPEILIVHTNAEELLFITGLGYKILMENGTAYLNGDTKAKCKLIMDELKEFVTGDDRYSELKDYIEFHMWSDDVFLNEIEIKINEVRVSKAFEITFLDIFEVIAMDWKLTENQKEVLNNHRKLDLPF